MGGDWTYGRHAGDYSVPGDFDVRHRSDLHGGRPGGKSDRIGCDAVSADRPVRVVLPVHHRVRRLPSGSPQLEHRD